MNAVLESFSEADQITWDDETSVPSGPPRIRGRDILYLDAPGTFTGHLTLPLTRDGVEGGCGKTAVMKLLAAHLRLRGYVVICVASTGKAAGNYEGGITGHSMFKLPLDPQPGGVCNLSMRKERAQLLRRARLIIYDEFPNVHYHSFSSFLRLLDDLHGQSQPHPDVTILTAGDFRQCPPVVKYGSPGDILKASVKFHPAFQQARRIYLTINMRARDDPQYAAMALSFGNGEGRTVMLGKDKAKLPVCPVPLIQVEQNMDRLICFVYPNFDEANLRDNMRRAILSGTNENIDQINMAVLSTLPGEWITLLSADRARGEDGDQLDVSPEVLASVNEVGIPPHQLLLKPNAIVIITRNLSFDSRLVNSTKVYFLSFVCNFEHYIYKCRR